MSESEDELKTYAVRPSDKVADQIEAEHQRLTSVFGADAADRWEDSLADAIASLAALPNRCPAAEEIAVFARVRPSQTLQVLFISKPQKALPGAFCLVSMKQAKTMPLRSAYSISATAHRLL